MEHTLPPPNAPRLDTFYADLLRALARLLFYPRYWPCTHLPAFLFKLTQRGLLLWAQAHRSRFDPSLAHPPETPSFDVLTTFNPIGYTECRKEKV